MTETVMYKVNYRHFAGPHFWLRRHKFTAVFKYCKGNSKVCQSQQCVEYCLLVLCVSLNAKGSVFFESLTSQ